MTPEAERFLQNADDHLERGEAMLSAGLSDDPGRAAYLAAFHAAQAILFEREPNSQRRLQPRFFGLTNLSTFTVALA